MYMERLLQEKYTEINNVGIHVHRYTLTIVSSNVYFPNKCLVPTCYGD